MSDDIEAEFTKMMEAMALPAESLVDALLVHPMWSMTGQEAVRFFDTAADEQNDAMDHAMMHAAATVIVMFHENPEYMADKYLKSWLEGLYDMILAQGSNGL